MSGPGRKLKEVITIRASFDGGMIDGLSGSYPSVDDAVVEARRFYRENRKHYKKLDVSVCFGEFEYESGDVWGEPTCLSIKDLKPPRRK